MALPADIGRAPSKNQNWKQAGSLSWGRRRRLEGSMQRIDRAVERRRE